MAELLRVESISKSFPVRGGFLGGPRATIAAVNGVSFSLAEGETLGLVGESGSGKSTTGRMIVRLLDPTSGQVEFKGQDITRLQGAALRAARRDLQMVFQDPFSSLDPRMLVEEVVAEPLRAHRVGDRRAVRNRVAELLELVSLSPAQGRRRPGEFSGGQRQRIGIARALALSPKVVVLDEPVSALDVSVQAQILNLLSDLQQALGVAFVLISHDLSVVQHVARRVAVMYLGRIVELGDTDEIFGDPSHPYTKALLSAIPVVDPDRRRAAERIVLRGEPASATDLPTGCAFRSRCWRSEARCAVEVPPLASTGGRAVACFNPIESKSLTVPTGAAQKKKEQ